MPVTNRRKPDRRVQPLFAAACLLVAWLGTTGPASAQGEGRFHWAYAANFGTGRYAVTDDSQVFVVRIPVRVRLSEADPQSRCNCTIRLLAPLTLGVETFDRDATGNRPERARHVGILPGVELEFARSDRWTLRVQAQAGWGTHKHVVRENAFIYAAGIRSRLAWPQAPGRPAMINGLLLSGYDPNNGARQSMARLSNGVEFDLHLKRWQFRDHTMRLMPHLLSNWYVDPVDARALVDGRTGGIDSEWEVGVAAGRTRPFEILGFRLDRIGIGIRESSAGTGVRIFFGSIF